MIEDIGKKENGGVVMKQSFNAEWEDIHSTQEWGAYPSEHIIRFIARNYYKLERSNVKILDFGCGAGAHAWYLAREGFDVYAFDGSQSAIKRAQARLEREGLSAYLKVADALDTGYPDDFFDAVVDNFCVYSNLTEGVLAGRGITHFYSEEELKTLLSQTGFHDIHIDTILYTDNQNQVEQYIARAAK